MGQGYVHFGSPASYAGILLCVRLNILKQAAVTFREILPGRLVHVQLAFANRKHHVLAVYQHAWNPAKAQDCLGWRSNVWTVLGETLSSLGDRNSKVVLGDLNTDLVTGDPQYSPPAGHSAREPRQPDADRLRHLMVKHNLLAVNALGRWRPTFRSKTRGELRQSRVDFVLVPRHDVDGYSKDCHYHLEFPLLSTRLGSRHIPMSTSLKVAAVKRQHTAGFQGFTVRDRTILSQALSGKDKNYWQQEACVQLECCTDMQQFEKQLYRNACNILEQLKPPPVPILVPTCKNENWSTHIHKLWQHYAAYRTHRKPYRLNIFKAWWHYVKFHQMSKRSKMLAKQARRDNVDLFLANAHDAALTRDTSTWYKAINRLCPKSKQSTITLRSKDGHLLTPEESVHTLKQYFSDLYTDPHYEHTPPGPGTLCIDAPTLMTEITRLPTAKALHPQAPPASMWKAAGGHLVPVLLSELHQVWEQDHMLGARHQDWITSHLHLLPKPNKAPRCPAALRPIALQHPVCKIVSGAIATLATQDRPHLFDEYPLFASLEGRPCSDCLSRAFAHCDRAYRLAQALTTKHRTWNQRNRIAGGIQLCVDLSKAFDKVSRSHLREAILDCEFSQEIEHALVFWLENNNFTVTSHDQAATFSCNRGIKQGSREAPFLWNVFFRFLLKKASQTLGWKTIQRILTIYADDTHGAWEVRTIREAEKALKDIAFFLGLLTEHGLEVNASKSFVLCCLRGPAAEPFFKKYLRRTPDGVFLKCQHRPGGHLQHTQRWGSSRWGHHR